MMVVPKIIDFVVRDYNAVIPEISFQGNRQECLNAQKITLIPSAVSKTLQRRLSPLAKVVFNVAQTCLGNDKTIPIIFCTAHGETHKSLAMLRGMQSGEDISPAAFSLSVHSAISGLFSIAFANHQEIIVIAPGQDGISVAFIEALGLLQEGRHKEVLLVFYDETLPDFFSACASDENMTASGALALRLALAGNGVSLAMSRELEIIKEVDHVSQMLSFWEFLMSDAQSLVLGNHRHAWKWSKK